ncbi:MAG: DUF1049 domain-containing protein [Oscillatoriales cyanobacterium SM2_2_1]|nr:DUF1049 domain-containing protein [Oscillatoriales cyanobacterium SM2_2_1]
MTGLRLGLLVCLWVLLMGVAIFATQNQELVTVHFLYAESIRVPLGLVLIGFGGGGGVLWALGALGRSPQIAVPAQKITPPGEPVRDRPKPSPRIVNDWDEGLDDDWG